MESKKSLTRKENFVLEVDGLTKSFGGAKVLDNCSFHVRSNSITVLVGPNGAGKTVVFDSISGITRGEYGKILLRGRDLSKLSMEKISNSGISRMFQSPQLFENLSVKDNLFLALDDGDSKFWESFMGKRISLQAEKKVFKVLSDFDMEEFGDVLGRDLSYGQKRLVELARAVLKPHKILILDEPVAGVNPELRKKICKILDSFRDSGKTVLLIEHDMDFVFEIADELIVLDSGRVVAQGDPVELSRDVKLSRNYLGGKYVKNK